jgi:hypothetical protein
MPSEPPSPRLWTPLDGPQNDALSSAADILFYGGAAGGGKTDLLIGVAFTRHRRSIIFRREYTQLRAIIDRTVDLFADFGRFSKTDMVWTLDDGRMIELGAVQHPGDERKYQGRAHDLKAFDELAHFSEAQFRMLCGWLRSADPAQRCRVIATGNPPTYSEGEWIIRFFAPWLDRTHARPAKPGELRWYTTIDGKDKELESGEPFDHNGETIVPKSRTFIKARVEDNHFYMKSGYKATLQALPEPLRSKLLYGDFSVGMEDDPFQLIPTDWLELAAKRHEQGAGAGRPLDCIGVDVARGGRDRTVITLRHAGWFAPQQVYPGSRTPDGEVVAQLVLAARGASPCRVNVDVIGVGASAFDALRRHIGDKAHALNSAQASDARDKTGTLGFVNRRAEWWWLLREALDPSSCGNLALPPDRELLSDLATPHYHFTTRGVQIESKDDIVKRIGRSPDKGDSLVYALARNRAPGEGFMDYYAQRMWDS